MKLIKTLVLYSRGAPTGRQILTDTVLRGLCKMPYSWAPPSWLEGAGWFGKKIANRINDPYAGLGYVNDWRDAFKSNSELEVIECNINDILAYRNIKPLLREVPLVVVLHSCAGDDLKLLLATSHWFQDRKGKLAVFFGNEYDLMEEKQSFLTQSGAEYVCSQLPKKAAVFLYSDVESVVVEMPHALNPSIYQPGAYADKKIKIGFVGAKYPNWIGDGERNNFLEYCDTHFEDREKVIKIGGKNVARDDWASLLRRSAGTIGAEAGTYYLDRKGSIVKAAKKHALQKRNGSDEIFDVTALLDGVEYVSGKAISSRHFEPMGTKTVQILLEGNYNGILEPGLHYLAVRKDMSNFPDKILEFSDPCRRAEIADGAYEYAMQSHTYAHRVQKFIEVVSC
jgi:hypothetical protein